MPSAPSIVMEASDDSSYTRHGGAVISLGWDTDVYRWLLAEIPEVVQLTLDVTRFLPAPPRAERIRGTFPDNGVICQVREQEGFSACVSACHEVLASHGIVLVMCKGGRHRAPTVAHEMSQKGRYVVHATLRWPSISPAHVACLIHACVRCRSRDTFYNMLLTMPNQRLCVGWSPGNPDTRETHTEVPYVKHGARVQVLEADETDCVVRVAPTEYTCKLPLTWLLPESVCQSYVRVDDRYQAY